MRRAPAVACLAALLALAAPAAASAANPPGCAPPVTTGGEWRSYGGDLANSRSQSHEQVLSAADVPTLAVAWSFSSVSNGGSGDFTGTPVVADGCTYSASSRGTVFAINADTGKLVWKAQLPFGGGVNSSVAVAQRTLPVVKRARAQAKKKKQRTSAKKHRKHRRKARSTQAAATAGTVYVAVTRTQKLEGCPPGDPCTGPYVAAFDQATGALVWATPPIDTQPGADVYASPIVDEGVLMIGVSGGSAELGDEADRYAFQGSMNFVDASTGAILKKTWTIHAPNQPADDFAGGGIWSTPAIDSAEDVAYVGTANPFKPQAEHPHTNAILKFDVDPASPTFGDILGSYKGTTDVYADALEGLPCYDIPGNPPPYYPQGLGSCGDVDMDFGSSPNLFKDSSGRKLVGAGQKSGVYHVLDAATMKPVWTQITGPPSPFGGIVGSTAVADGAIYGPDTVPGYVWSLGRDDGAIKWVGPIADGMHWGPPVTYANGVLYSVDLGGFLDAFDARRGTLLARRPLGLGGNAVSPSWGGVSVARHTIYASVGVLGLADGTIVALRPGPLQDIADDASDTTPGGAGGGGLPAGSSVVSGPGAASTGYATPVAVIPAGGKLSYLNLDLVQHDVTARDKGADGQPLFRSKLIGLGETADVEGVDKLAAGSFAYFCSVHPGMQGTLIVR